MSDEKTARETAHDHIGICDGEHTKQCDMLTVEFGELIREINKLATLVAEAGPIGPTPEPEKGRPS